MVAGFFLFKGMARQFSAIRHFLSRNKCTLGFSVFDQLELRFLFHKKHMSHQGLLSVLKIATAKANNMKKQI
jgi:hypothetical protein